MDRRRRRLAADPVAGVPAIWRRLALALAVATVGFLGVKGPLYKALGVQPIAAYAKLGPFLHHISAHLDHGTPLTADDRRLVAEIHPLKDGKWPYDPTRSRSAVL